MSHRFNKSKKSGLTRDYYNRKKITSNDYSDHYGNYDCSNNDYGNDSENDDYGNNSENDDYGNDSENNHDANNDSENNHDANNDSENNHDYHKSVLRGKRGKRGENGCDGKNGSNGENGYNGKNGKNCDGNCSQSLHIDYKGTNDTYDIIVPVPTFARKVSVVAVAGGGSGGPGGGRSENPLTSGGVGGGSGFSANLNMNVCKGFLNLSIGRGGRNIENQRNGVSTTVTSESFSVFAMGGVSGYDTVPNVSPTRPGDGMYGGGGADGLPPLLPGRGFKNGSFAMLGVKGGDGGGPFAGVGGGSSSQQGVFGGGGGGGSPGPINGSGGRGGGIVNGDLVLNGVAGTRGGGGGGGGARFAESIPLEFGVGGNGGDGYVSLYFFP